MARVSPIIQVKFYTCHKSQCKECLYKNKLQKIMVLIIQKYITKATLRKDVGLSTDTMSKPNKEEEVALSILMCICDYTDCNIVVYVSLYEKTKNKETMSCQDEVKKCR